MTKTEVTKLLNEFTDRSKSSNIADSGIWMEAWKLLSEAQHQSNMKRIEQNGARRLAKIRKRRLASTSI